MEEQIGNVLTIMIVGMLTVVGILILVVFSGKILISILNKTGFKLNRADSDNQQENRDVIPQTVINAAIQKWSGNKATPVSIKRIK